MKIRKFSIWFVFFVLCFCASARAATFTVNSTADNEADGCAVGVCTLREAIAAATGGDSVMFASPLFDTAQTINLAGEQELVINKSLTVAGRAANLLTIRQNVTNRSAATRVLRIGDGSSNITVNLSGMTITGGDTDSQDDAGSGAGIRNEAGAETTLTDVHVTGNKSRRGNNAGGILNLGNLNIFDSTVSDNSLTDVTAARTGGGIENRVNLLVVNSTVSGNRAEGLPLAIDRAGGIHNKGSATIVNSTVTNNYAGGDPNQSAAGGVSNTGVGVMIRNSIVAGNFGGFPGQGITNDVAGSQTFYSQGYNLIGSVGAANGFGQIGDQTGSQAAPLDPRLDPLGMYGGATPTHRLKSDSSAIDRGDNCVLTANSCTGGSPRSLVTDQRGAGFARALDGDNDGTATVDIGAFEFQRLNPTAAAVRLGGRVLDSNGRGVAGALVVLIDAASGAQRAARTNPFGFYRFAAVAAGATYTLNARHKRFVFAARIISLSGDRENVDFAAQPVD